MSVIMFQEGVPKVTPLYVGSKRVAAVIGDTLNKAIYSSKHMLRRPPAICFDRSVLDEAESLGATTIKVHDLDEKKTYITTMQTFRAHCFRLQRGFGEQLGLTLDYWSIDGKMSPHEQQQKEKDERPTLFDLEAL